MGGNSPGSKIALWIQDTLTGLLQTPNIELSAYDIPQPIEIADLNCDEKNEIIVVHGGWLNASVYEQDSAGLYKDYKKFYVPYYTHYNLYGLAVGDINNDGRKDIAIGNGYEGLVLLYNATKPSVQQVVYTSSQIDTVYRNSYIIPLQFTVFDTFESHKYRITTANYFRVDNTYFEDSVRIDSVIIAKGSICGKEYLDTNQFSRTIHYVMMIKSDTILFSSVRDSLNLVKDINIHPTPTNGKITIELPNSYNHKNVMVYIYNNIGQLLFNNTYIKNISNMIPIDMSHFASGGYIVSISAEGMEIFTKRIIKIN